MKSIFNKKSLITSLRYVFGISFFIYVILKVDFQHVDFLSVHWIYLALSILPLIFFIIFQGIRFNKLLLVPLKFRDLLLMQFRMQFFNLILPSGIGGDAYRIFLLKHAEQSLTTVTSKSILDRLSGLILTSLMFVWGLPDTLTKFELNTELLTIAWAIISCGLLFSCYGLSRYWQGISLFKKGINLLGFSVLCWGTQICRLWFICIAIGVHVSIKGLAFMLGIIQMASLLPITVGGLGVIEGAFVFSAGLLGVDLSLAALGAILMRVTSIASGLIGFLIWLQGKKL